MSRRWQNPLFTPECFRTHTHRWRHMNFVVEVSCLQEASVGGVPGEAHPAAYALSLEEFPFRDVLCQFCFPHFFLFFCAWVGSPLELHCSILLTIVQPLNALAIVNVTSQPSSACLGAAAMGFLYCTWVFEAELPDQFSWLIFANQSSVRISVFVPQKFTQCFFFPERGADEDRAVRWRGSKNSRKFSVRSPKSSGLEIKNCYCTLLLLNPDCRNALHHNCFWLFQKWKLKCFIISQQAVLHGGVQVIEGRTTSTVKEPYAEVGFMCIILILTALMWAVMSKYVNNSPGLALMLSEFGLKLMLVADAV